MADPRSSAAYRIAFVYAAAFSIGVALLGIAIYFAMHASFIRELDAALGDEGSALAEEYRGGGDAELAEAIAKRAAVETRDLSAYGVFRASGERRYGNFHAPLPPLGTRDVAMRDRDGHPDVGRALTIDLGRGERLVVATDLEPVEKIDRMIVTIFAAGFAVVLALGLAGALVLGAYLRGRLDRLTLSAQMISAGDISHRMPVSPRNDEFDRLAATLNAMLERIERLLDNLRQVSGDVAHDLRTPLTRLRNQLESGRAEVNTGSSDRDIVARAVVQVDDILALFAAILRISEIESGEIARRFTTVDLSELVTEIAESYAPAIEEHGRSLTWEVAPGVAAQIDRELVAQALVNLIENAQRHTPPGSRVAIALGCTAGTATLTVSDDGPGVPAAEWPRITRRFVRLDRSRGASGHGLGLNLVDAVARLHRGTLDFFDNAPGLGAKLTIAATCMDTGAADASAANKGNTR